MPFTPFHFGLGALAKSLAPKKFSFVAFAISQIAMDIEPGIKIVTGLGSDLHAITHNILGAAFIGILSAAAYPIIQLLPQRFRPEKTSLKIVLCSALIGTFTHIFLDGMYHADMKQPQFGIADKLDIFNMSGTEVLCVIMLLVSAGIQLFRYAKGRHVHSPL